MYPHLDDSTHWSLPEVLAHQGRARADQTYVTMITGESLTYGHALADAQKVAGHFAALGVTPGMRVAFFLPNSLDFVRVWLGLGWLGAVAVPINTALTGEFLAHQLRSAHPALVVCHHEWQAIIEKVRGGIAPPFRVVVSGSADDGTSAREGDSRLDAWRSATPYDGPHPSYQDLACIMYTSGTTGPSKGTLMPHAHCYLFARGMMEAARLTEKDTFYITMPLFHANGLFMQLYGTLLAGGRAVVRERFSASSWIPDIREHGCTVSTLIGVMSHAITQQPAGTGERDHGLRFICSAPNPPPHEAAFRERFGVPTVISGFGMTEVNIPLYGRYEESRPGTCGFVLDRWFEVEIVDPETDQVMPRGEIGELVVRPKVPFAFMAGYDGLPDKTVETWRNFWFHTGDAGTMDASGCVVFRDRIKDCIRRRGENISSFEVEAAIGKVPGVAEVAAFAVPAGGGEGTEDEVMLAIVAHPGATLHPAAIVVLADAVLPAFAQPRFVEIVESLPKTADRARAEEQAARAGRHRRDVGPQEHALTVPLSLKPLSAGGRSS